jgi:hypothetical protein
VNGQPWHVAVGQHVRGDLSFSHVCCLALKVQKGGGGQCQSSACTALSCHTKPVQSEQHITALMLLTSSRAMQSNNRVSCISSQWCE